MKKISLILVLALVMVSAFAAVALADPNHPNNSGTASAGTYSNGATGQVYLPQDPGQTTWNGQPIHSDYTANTDACASCHTPHTAQGDDITQWSQGTEGATATCMACHDGTVTATYNVEQGVIGTTTSMPDGGKFAVLADGKDANGNGLDSSSQHNVFSALTIGGAAYGGNPTATSDSHGQWTGSFDCTSCHDPHDKGGNSVLLQPDPNDVQTVTTQTMTYDATLSAFDFPNGNRPITGYSSDPLAPTSINVSFDGGTTWTKAPALKFTTNGTIVNDVNSSVAYYPISELQALTGGSGVNSGSTVMVKYLPVLEVKITVQNKLQASELVSYDNTINTFCGACHTDFNTSAFVSRGSASTLTGDYTQAYRHQVGDSHSIPAALAPNNVAVSSGHLTCLTCHYAHGVDASVWANTATKTGISSFAVQESAGSSWLKRLPNMGVCEACHDKEDASYSANAVDAYMN